MSTQNRQTQPPSSASVYDVAQNHVIEKRASIGYDYHSTVDTKGGPPDRSEML
jgi:hypothetical protein